MMNWIEHGLNQCSLLLLFSIVLSLCILLQQQGTMGMAIVVPVVALVAAIALLVVQNPKRKGAIKLTAPSAMRRALLVLFVLFQECCAFKFSF